MAPLSALHSDTVAVHEDSASDDPATWSSKCEVCSASTAITTPSASFEAKTKLPTSVSQAQLHEALPGSATLGYHATLIATPATPPPSSLTLGASNHATLTATTAAPSPLHTNGGLTLGDSVATPQEYPDGIGTSTAYPTRRPEFEGTDQSWPSRAFPTHEPWYEEGPRAFLANTLFTEQRIRDMFPTNTFREDWTGCSTAGVYPSDAFHNNWYLLVEGDDVVQGIPPIKPEIIARIAAVDF
jgi:hypothetical protein